MWRTLRANGGVVCRAWFGIGPKCHLLDAFIQSLPTQYCGQSPQEHFGVKCLGDTTTCWRQWGLNLCSPDPNTNALIHCATRLPIMSWEPSIPQLLVPSPFKMLIVKSKVFPVFLLLCACRDRLRGGDRPQWWLWRGGLSVMGCSPSGIWTMLCRCCD